MPLPRKNEPLYWCTFEKYKTRTGDLVLIYVKGVGISQLFRVSAKGNPFEPEIRCAMLNMPTIYLELITNFDIPLTARDLRESKNTADINVVRRNFQGTTFQLDPKVFSTLIVKLAKNNAAKKSLLRKYMKMQ